MANKKLKNFEYANQSVKGQLPKVNTDMLSFFETENGFVFILADGEGSDETGAVAAQLAIDRIQYYLENEFVEKPTDALYNALVYANGFIYEQSRKDAAVKDRGVSLSCVLIRENKVFYSCIGDSRIYYFNGKKVFLLAQGNRSEIDSGISGDDSESKLVQGLLGKSRKIVPKVNAEALEPVNEDVIIMLSDGIFSTINEKSIQKIFLDQMPSQTKIYRLIDLANLESGNDNLSAQLISFYNLDNKERIFTPIKEKTSVKELFPSKMPDLSYVRGIVQDIVKQPLYKTILIALAFLLLGYMFYDLFLYDPRPARKIRNERIAREQIQRDTLSDQASVAESGITESTVNLPADATYLVRQGDTWNRIYSEFGVCSWFIRNHPPNSGMFDSSDNPIAGRRLSIPVMYSSKQNLNPNFYQEFSLQKTGSRCENANEEFLKNFREQNL
jgi:PPM family protein phosphatase